MKALVISDLHSNYQALEAIWKIEKDSDLIYCAGDLVDIGPYPNDVIEWLIEHKAHCIQGNHDKFAIDLIQNKSNLALIPAQDKSWLQYNAEILKPKNFEFLKSLPLTLSFKLDGKDYFMKHIYNEYLIIQSKFEFELFMKNQNVPTSHRLIMGHTHKQTLTYFSDTQTMLNPGSTAYRTFLEPENSCQKTEYITITNGNIELKSIQVDNSDFLKRIKSLDGIVNTSWLLNRLNC